MSEWLRDGREIRRVRLVHGEEFDLAAGDTFERIERDGEMAAVPWVKIFTNYRDGVLTGNRRVVEAPLAQAAWVEFGK